MNETNSTMGLYIDAFPYDPAASLDSDGDGLPDRWNPGMGQLNSTSNPPLELDPYPDDPDNVANKEDDDTEMPVSVLSWIVISLSLAVGILVVMGILSHVMTRRKQLRKQAEDITGRIEPDHISGSRESDEEQ